MSVDLLVIFVTKSLDNAHAIHVLTEELALVLCKHIIIRLCINFSTKPKKELHPLVGPCVLVTMRKHFQAIHGEAMQSIINYR